MLKSFNMGIFMCFIPFPQEKLYVKCIEKAIGMGIRFRYNNSETK